MIDWKKPIETVDGRAAKVLSRGYWRNGETYCVVQVENPETGDSEILIVNPTTGYGHAAIAASTTSIRNAPVKREGWVVKYKDQDRLWDYRIFSSEEIAIGNSPVQTVVVRMQWEE